MEIKVEIPHLGQMVVVRGRAGIVEDINQFSTKEEVLYSVEVRYIDGWSFPERDTVIWQREWNPKVIKGSLLPKILKTSPDSKENFHNFINAYRWSTVNKVTVNEEEDSINFIAPWQSAIQVEDYQLYPLLKALLMPRISLLLADDVGLGKTIEAGLIMSELVARGRLKRVLIICPASLQLQWKDELKEKFNLDFEIIDRKKSIEMKREFGINTNQWTVYPRIITSMDYIRQPDVKEKFKAACEILKINEAKMPWNMLVVDEVHNFSPNVFGESSQRYETLKEIGSKFEHKMFLTATPHNGYTYAFTGLLELLDPVRFSQIDSINEEYKKHIDNVMIRRLKKDLNTKSKQRFANRTVEAININLNYKEAELFDVLRQYKKYGMQKLQEVGKRETQLGQFMFNLLSKRLLSDPYAFACTWWNKIYNNLDDDVSIDEVKYIYKKVESLTEDDVEREDREVELISKGSRWINTLGIKNDNYIYKINKLLDDMGFSEENINMPLEEWSYIPSTSKMSNVIEFIKNNICIEGDYLKDERVIIFTEYKQTLNYIKELLKRNEIVEPYIDILFGGMNIKERQLLKERFNSEDSNLKILLATDAASEGINLQNGCRYILHYDIPWNPMRMEQRNGRIDRHGQQRDVFIYHFTSDDDIDLRFLDKIVNKINQVREDLGSVSQVIDGIVQNHFNNEESKNNIDNVNLMKLKTTLKTNVKEIENIKAYQRLKATELNLKLSEDNLYNLLSYSLRSDGGNIEEIENGIYRITKLPPKWKNIINESLEIEKGSLVGLPKITFNPEQFKKIVNGREFYINREDTVLMRLAHPMMQKAILDIKKELWDGKALNRWTILESNLPYGIDSIVKIFILVEVVNELGERIHQEIIEKHYQIRDDELIEIEYELIREINNLETKAINKLSSKIDLLYEIEDELVDNLLYQYRCIKKNKENELVKLFSDKYALEIEKQKLLYDERLESLKSDKIQKKINKINESIGVEYSKLYGPDQLGFFSNFSDIAKENINKLEKEKEILEINIDATRKLLKEERNTVLKSILPKKYKISNCEVWPLGIEIMVSS